MSNFKRVLSLVLVVLMIVPMFALPTSAAETCSIIINYVYENDYQAAPPFTATVAKGSAFSQTVTSPEVQGYAPDEAHKVIVIDEKAVNDNITVKVTYHPAEVNFTVKRYQQNIADDKYKLFETETMTGYTESQVGADLAKSYNGFTALLYDTTTTIAADGSTVVDIYYDRNYYMLSLDLAGGYGAEPVYARYDAPIEIATPEKPGYTFVGWNPTAPETMPAANTTLTAQWNAGQATYLVQYWLENANDDNYSYDSSIQKTATVGSTVNGAGDKSYTGFTFEHANQNVVIKGDGTSVVNVYYKRNRYTLTFQVRKYSKWNTVNEFKNVKYGEDTTKYWNQAQSGYLWYTTKNGTTFYTAAPDMPNNNLTIYGRTSSGSSVIHYYEYGTQNSIKPDLRIAIDGWSFTVEDYIAIPGFTYDSSIRNKLGTVYTIYYTRNNYKLDFNSNGVIVKSENVPYEKALSEYNFTPNYPASLEAGAYEFVGWFTDPGCTVAVDWANEKMPYHNTILYAKWTPITHTVRTFLTKDEVATGTPIDTWKDIPHRSVINPAPADPENGNYVFVGWFYEENGVEKAYDFSIAVTKNLDLYAKWSSNTLVEYTIYYKLRDGGTVIAAETRGSALAGTTKTFEAKFGDELDEGYRTGYYPETASHSVTMDINGDNIYTFYYVAKQNVNYTVRYLEVGTENVLHEKKHAETTDNVITEKFVPVSGYIPDASFKRLILSANDGENVITFWYTKDEVHALVTVRHYFQNIEGDGYTEDTYYTYTGDIGKTYTEEAKNVDGFTYNAEKSTASGELTQDGLFLDLYYDRNAYSYEFKFVDRTTYEEIDDSVTGTARYQKHVTERYKNLESKGYMLDSAESLAITITTDESKNVATFYYVPYFNVVHVKHDSEYDINVDVPQKVKMNPENIPYGKYSLTDAVSEGYLYGGAFGNVSCDADTVQTFAEGENAIEFTPVKGETYYIWEVPERYLVPRTYRVWRHIPGEGRKGVIKLFFLTTIDRNEYGELGFTMDGVDYKSTLDETNDVALNDIPTTYGVINAMKSSELYEQLYVSGGSIAASPTPVAESDRDTGYIGIYKMNSEQFAEFSAETGNTVTFQPYWITLDGIKVTGTETRTCKYLGIGNDKVGVENITVGSTVSSVSEATTETMAFCAEYMLSDDLEAVVDPVDPVEPCIYAQH